MKKTKNIVLFFIGGSVGITLMRISYIVTYILLGQVNQEIKDLIKSFLLTFIWGGICFTIATLSIRKIERKDMRSLERQKMLKKQMKIALFIILWFSMFLIVYIIKNNNFGIILSLSFITVFALWEYGYLLA